MTPKELLDINLSELIIKHYSQFLTQAKSQHEALHEALGEALPHEALEEQQLHEKAKIATEKFLNDFYDGLRRSQQEDKAKAKAKAKAEKEKDKDKDIVEKSGDTKSEQEQFTGLSGFNIPIKNLKPSHILFHPKVGHPPVLVPLGLLEMVDNFIFMEDCLYNPTLTRPKKIILNPSRSPEDCDQLVRTGNELSKKINKALEDYFKDYHEIMSRFSLLQTDASGEALCARHFKKGDIMFIATGIVDKNPNIPEYARRLKNDFVVDSLRAGNLNRYVQHGHHQQTIDRFKQDITKKISYLKLKEKEGNLSSTDAENLDTLQKLMKENMTAVNCFTHTSLIGGREVIIFFAARDFNDEFELIIEDYCIPYWGYGYHNIFNPQGRTLVKVHYAKPETWIEETIPIHFRFGDQLEVSKMDAVLGSLTNSILSPEFPDEHSYASYEFNIGRKHPLLLADSEQYYELLKLNRSLITQEDFTKRLERGMILLNCREYTAARIDLELAFEHKKQQLNALNFYQLKRNIELCKYKGNVPKDVLESLENEYNETCAKEMERKKEEFKKKKQERVLKDQHELKIRLKQAIEDKINFETLLWKANGYLSTKQFTFAKENFQLYLEYYQECLDQKYIPILSSIINLCAKLEEIASVLVPKSTKSKLKLAASAFQNKHYDAALNIYSYCLNYFLKKSFKEEKDKIVINSLNILIEQCKVKSKEAQDDAKNMNDILKSTIRFLLNYETQLKGHFDLDLSLNDIVSDMAILEQYEQHYLIDSVAAHMGSDGHSNIFENSPILYHKKLPTNISYSENSIKGFLENLVEDDVDSADELLYDYYRKLLGKDMARITVLIQKNMDTMKPD